MIRRIHIKGKTIVKVPVEIWVRECDVINRGVNHRQRVEKRFVDLHELTLLRAENRVIRIL